MSDIYILCDSTELNLELIQDAIFKGNLALNLRNKTNLQRIEYLKILQEARDVIKEINK